MNKIRILGLAAILGLALASSITAQAQKPGKGVKHENAKLEKLAVELGLSVAQKTQIKGIMTEEMSKARVIKMDNSLTEDQKKAKLKDIKKDAHKQILAVLTPEQQAKLKAMHHHKGAPAGGTAPPPPAAKP